MPEHLQSKGLTVSKLDTFPFPLISNLFRNLCKGLLIHLSQDRGHRWLGLFIFWDGFLLRQLSGKQGNLWKTQEKCFLHFLHFLKPNPGCWLPYQMETCRA